MEHAAPIPPLSVIEIKAVVRHRDGYRCTRCGMTAVEHIERYGRSLDVHRVTPGSTYSIDGCVAVCRRCHGPLPKSLWGRVPPRNGQVKVQCELPPALDRAVRRFAKDKHHSLRSVAIMALERYLERMDQ